MWSSRQVFRQQIGHPPTLTRSGEAPVRVWLDVEPAALAAAAATCGRASFPVDCAVTLCAEALAAASRRPLLDALRETSHRLPPAVAALAQSGAWERQLAIGCDWYDDTLPGVIVGARAVDALERVGAPAVVCALGDPLALALLREADLRASAAGLTLGEAIADAALAA